MQRYLPQPLSEAELQTIVDEEVGEAEGVTIEQARALALRLGEHIADRLSMAHADFWRAAEDWTILEGSPSNIAGTAAYSRAKLAELGIAR